MRYVLGGEPVNIQNNGKPHTIRIKSVLAATGTVVMLDYLEFVPKSVWGIEDAEGGYLKANQYSRPQMDYFSTAFEMWYERCDASTAKTLEFTTDAS